MPIVLSQKGLVGCRTKNQSQQNQRLGYSTSEIPCVLGLMEKSCQLLPYKVIAKKLLLILSLNLLFYDSCLYMQQRVIIFLVLANIFFLLGYVPFYYWSLSTFNTSSFSLCLDCSFFSIKMRGILAATYELDINKIVR